MRDVVHNVILVMAKYNSFDFTEAEAIDGLICHDQTATYKKGATTAGLPDPLVDLNAVAQSVSDNGGVPGGKTVSSVMLTPVVATMSNMVISPWHWSTPHENTMSTWAPTGRI